MHQPERSCQLYKSRKQENPGSEQNLGDESLDVAIKIPASALTLRDYVRTNVIMVADSRICVQINRGKMRQTKEVENQAQQSHSHH